MTGRWTICVLLLASAALAAADEVEVREVEGQPLAAQALRLKQALEFLGDPLPAPLAEQLRQACQRRDAREIQKLLDPHVLLSVSINPEVRVKVRRGPAAAKLRQGGHTPLLIKVINDSTITRQLRIRSPQAGRVYAGASLNILQRQQQTELKDGESERNAGKFLEVSLFQSPPLTKNLSGLEVEYAIALISSSEAGKREATIAFDVGAGTQDIGFRGEAPVLFDVQGAVDVPLSIRDVDGQPTTARIEIRDKRGRVYPSQAKRLAPDFFFQPQVYRHDGETVRLPPGEYSLLSSRGPEYRVQRQTIKVDSEARPIEIRLQRWIDPMKFGFYSGDHHIHGAGCSHYTLPTQGVRPEDMFRQVKGEGLNVGCVLTWGPCFEFQRQYFAPDAARVSEPLTLLKYDLEISGFGSAALGHVCLLNLKDQTYPGSEGGKDKGWPSWTVPVLRWCKEQGGVTGYPHSAIHVNPEAAAKRLLRCDTSGNGSLDRDEAAKCLLPEKFASVDSNRDGQLGAGELRRSVDRAADQLPNLALPAMNGGGAMEIFVSVPAGVCDFISAMDTARIPEWNTWYHLLNCGFPLRLSGETDFPCMSSRRVGQGRVYVQLGETKQLQFAKWCQGIAAGRSYVSDGFAHAVRFTVEDASPGGEPIALSKPGTVTVKARVAMAEEVPQGVAYGNQTPEAGRRMVGDTINLHAPRSDKYIRGGRRLIELVVNGQVAAEQWVPADGQIHDLQWEVEVERSSWIGLRHFPQLHTNVVEVHVAGKPIRASSASARWCGEAVQVLWENRHQKIRPEEREAAKAAYDRAQRIYERIAREAEAP